VCKGLTSEFGPEVVPILLHTTLAPHMICEAARFCPPSDEWEDQPAAVARSLNLPEHLATPVNTVYTANGGVRILHLSDIHWDDFYAEGSIADCPEPLCCRPWSTNGVRKAGKWGDYNCDLSEALFDAMLQELASITPPFNAVVWTGDNPPHDVWNETQTGQLERIKKVTQKLSQAFPKIPVFPAIGNHDTFPVDQFNRHPKDAAHYDDFEWLTGSLASFWSHWLPSDAVNTLASGGYYTALIMPGFRVIALNSQWGDIINFYLYLLEDQNTEQFSWFVQVLTAAEAAGEKVIIIGHIPPGEAAIKQVSTYATDYVQIVNRFSTTIVGQFYGHTHDDEFEVITNGTHATGTVFLAPSVTTYTYHEPSYRIYEFDNTFTLVNFEQYITNLTLANELDKPAWYLEYTAKEEYQMPDLSPASWAQLVEQFKYNDALFQTYYSNFHTQVLNSKCEGDCKIDKICSCQPTHELYIQCYAQLVVSSRSSASAKQ